MPNVELNGAFTRPVEAGFCRNEFERLVIKHYFFSLVMKLNTATTYFLKPLINNGYPCTFAKPG